MAVCEKCWADAHLRAQDGRSQTECYRELLAERASNPCEPTLRLRGWKVGKDHASGATYYVCPEGHEVSDDMQGCPWCWKKLPASIRA